VGAMLKTVFAQQAKADTEAQRDAVADALGAKQLKLGALMDASRENVLACMDFPWERWPQIVSIDSWARANMEITR
jgi:putative transposase